MTVLRSIQMTKTEDIAFDTLIRLTIFLFVAGGALAVQHREGEMPSVSVYAGLHAVGQAMAVAQTSTGSSGVFQLY